MTRKGLEEADDMTESCVKRAFCSHQTSNRRGEGGEGGEGREGRVSGRRIVSKQSKLTIDRELAGNAFQGNDDFDW
jgi:hypothetical protein